jgi:hypothetical protein
MGSLRTGRLLTEPTVHSAAVSGSSSRWFCRGVSRAQPLGVRGGCNPENRAWPRTRECARPSSFPRASLGCIPARSGRDDHPDTRDCYDHATFRKTCVSTSSCRLGYAVVLTQRDLRRYGRSWFQNTSANLRLDNPRNLNVSRNSRQIVQFCHAWNGTRAPSARTVRRALRARGVRRARRALRSSPVTTPEKDARHAQNRTAA